MELARQLYIDGYARRLALQSYVCPTFLRLISMRYGSSLWLTFLVTTSLVAGSGESFGQEAGKTPPPAIAPFDAAQAKVHQKAWADHLGVPVELKNSVGVQFVLIPPGEFMMGSPESEPGREKNETQHTVVLSNAFSIGIHEVTQEQYEQVAGSNPSRFKGTDNPVEHVSWEDAVAFCEKLSALPAEQAAGRVYRLPTEAEWEYACRAGTTTAFSFGDDEQDLGKYAWFRDNGGRTTHAVGEKLPNGWGLYDMHGNDGEWCSDWYKEDYPKGAVTDPVGPSIAWGRMIRGGNWQWDAALCRSASRSWLDPSIRPYFIGFRLALSSPSVESPEAKEVK